MAYTTSQAIISAAKDADLRERIIAIAAKMKVKNPGYFVDSNLFELASTAVDSTGENSIATVYDFYSIKYAKATAELVPPGKNLAAVTDENIEHALRVLLTAETPVQEG